MRDFANGTFKNSKSQFTDKTLVRHASLSVLRRFEVISKQCSGYAEETL